MKIEEFINGDMHPTKNFWTVFLPVSLLLGFSPLFFGIQQGTNQAKIWGIFTILIATPITISLWRSIAKHTITGFWKYFLRLQCIISAATVLTLLITLVLAIFYKEEIDDTSDLTVKFLPCEKTSKGMVFDERNYISQKFFVKDELVIRKIEYLGDAWELEVKKPRISRLQACTIIDKKNWKCSEAEYELISEGKKQKTFVKYEVHQVINGKYDFSENPSSDVNCPAKYVQIK